MESGYNGKIGENWGNRNAITCTCIQNAKGQGQTN